MNVYHYLTYLLEKRPNDRMSDKEFEQLAPWNEEVKAEIKRRAANLKKQVLGDYKKIPTTRRQSDIFL